MLINKYITILFNLFKNIKINNNFDESILKVINDVYDLIKDLSILTNYDLEQTNILLSNIYQYLAYHYYHHNQNKKLSHQLSVQAQFFNTKLNEEELFYYRQFQSNCFESIRDSYTHSSLPIQLNISKEITVTITTCKRLDLFLLTMHSFFNCCKDLDMIKEILVVDDNSSSSDREIMIKTFPFIKYYFKTEEEKGHYKSMNIILNSLTTKYQFHLEDDWKFIYPSHYFKDCIEVLHHQHSDKYAQCLLNRNYAEESFCYNIIGGIMKFTNTNKRYYEHEYYSSPEELNSFIQKNPKSKQVAYWPHYSLRVGLNKVNHLKKVGEYKNVDFFEREYALRYVKLGFITTFLDGVNCLHSGRKTWEMNDTKVVNAYTLNQQDQFGKFNKKLTTPRFIQYEEKQHKATKIEFYCFLINLDRRPDRLKKFQEINKNELNFSIQRVAAIDGQQLTTNTRLLKLFETGDYKYRRGIVGCALSHLLIWFQPICVNDNVLTLILEDDVVLTKHFYRKLNHIICEQLVNKDWDICFLGHHLYPQYRQESEYSQDEMPTVTRWFRKDCIQKSMGGTAGYLINKKGAYKLLDIIRNRGVYNGIDWIMFKSTKEDENDSQGLNIYYSSPHIIFSECVTGDNKVDSDIQFDMNTSLYIDANTRLLNNINFLFKELKQDSIQLLNYVHIFDVKTSNNSKILLTQYLPSKSIFLTKITIIDYTKYKEDSIIVLQNKIKTYPICWYAIEDKQKYLILIPEPLLTKNIENEFVFGGYLDINTLKNIK